MNDLKYLNKIGVWESVCVVTLPCIGRCGVVVLNSHRKQFLQSTVSKTEV